MTATLFWRTRCDTHDGAARCGVWGGAESGGEGGRGRRDIARWVMARGIGALSHGAFTFSPRAVRPLCRESISTPSATFDCSTTLAPFARRNLEALPCEQFNRVLFMTQIPRQDPAIDTKVLLGALFFKDIVKRRSGGEQIRRDNIVNELWDSISLDAAGTDYVQIGKLDAAALAQVGLKSGVQ